MIIGRGINDVAIVDLTLAADSAHAGQWTDNGLYQVADELRHELAKVDNVGSAYVVGGSPSQIRVEPDPERLSLYGVTLNQLVDKLSSANRSFVVGALREDGRSLPVVAGQTLQGVPDIGLLLLTTRDGRPVYVKDVANVVVGAAESDHRAWTMTKLDNGDLQRRPAVTLAIAKRKGANAVAVADDVLSRLEIVKGRIVPPGLEVTVTRNYGATATEKANELLFHLGLATLSIVVLISLAIGWREGMVVFIVIPTTILLTMFASWLMGYTINRVSLFALIFSIGILVDDAIVVVENISRHWSMRGERGLVETAVEAVAEVGNPTIVATLTIVAALLPMMFVSGMMGPYMSPIPANASIAMLFSFGVAVTVTPWLLLRIAGRHAATIEHGEGHTHDIGALGRLYTKIATPLLSGRRRSQIFLVAVGLATLAVCALFATKDVRVKLLPFDNKSEIQVVLDMPQGTALEETDRALMAAAERLKTVPELTSIQAYAGAAAPFNFNGLVRHYYLRDEPQQGDLAVNLVDKSERKRASHAIALDIRHRLADLPLPAGHGAQSGRGAARPAGAFHRAGRNLWPRPGEPARAWRPKCARRSRRSTLSSTSTTASPSRPSACASRSTSRRWNSTASTSRRSTTRSPACSAARRSAIRNAATASSRSTSPSPCRARRARLTSASCRRRCRPAARFARAPTSSLATSSS